MKIAVIAPGMMGAAVAQRLHACRATVAVTLDGTGTGFFPMRDIARLPSLVSWTVITPVDTTGTPRR